MSIQTVISKMYYLHCYDCSSCYEMIKTDDVYECPECYRQVNSENVNSSDLELNYFELRQYILQDNETIKAKIIEYLIYIGHADVVDDENLIEKYYEDLKQPKIAWKHELFTQY